MGLFKTVSHRGEGGGMRTGIKLDVFYKMVAKVCDVTTIT